MSRNPKKDSKPNTVSTKSLYIVVKSAADHTITLADSNDDIVFFNPKGPSGENVVCNADDIQKLLTENNYNAVGIFNEKVLINSDQFQQITTQYKSEEIFELKAQRNKIKIYNSVGFIVPINDFKILLSNKVFDCNNPIRRIEYVLNSSQKKTVVKEFDGAIIKSKSNGLIGEIGYRFNWFFKIPFNKEIPSMTGNQPLFRGLFAALLTFLLIAMPVVSWFSGISGDEEKHHEHAKYVYNYFTTLGKDTTALAPKNNHLLEYYGQSFDNAAYFLIKAFDIEKYYEFRHVLNSLTGWIIILFTGLIAAFLIGWRAAFITSLLMFISPRFMGHALNNPVDIPFAMGCVIALYYILKFNKNFPYFKFRTLLWLAIGLGVAVSIRIGGLLFVAMTVFFTGLNYLVKYGLKGFTDKKIQPLLLRLIFVIGGASVIGYLLGLVLWPYGLVSPIKNPLNALTAMTNIANSLRQIFEGEVIWSDDVPWYYTLKYMLISIPSVILLGLVLFTLFIRSITSRVKFITVFILLFTFVFPIVYIIIKESNIYGGWRHMNFVYPAIVVCAGLGLNQLLNLFKKNKVQLVVGIVLMGLAYHPILHYMKNIPHHYIYYNDISGGIKNAYAKYETDYYYHSMKAASDWIIKNKLETGVIPSDSTITVASNHVILSGYYFRNHENVKVKYVRYYDRGETDWQYATYVNSFLSPYQLKRKIWPPKNTIHNIEVSGYPICAILERQDLNDLKGYNMMKSKRYNEAIFYLKQSLKYDPNYENSWLNLTESYINTGQYSKAVEAGASCLKTYKDYENALYFIGLAYLNMQKVDHAIMSLNRVVKVNFKYSPAYFYLGYAYLMKNDNQNALKNLEEAINRNPNNANAYQLLGKVHENLGNKQMAQQYYNAFKQLTGQ